MTRADLRSQKRKCRRAHFSCRCRNFSASTSQLVEERSGAGGASEGLAKSVDSDAAASHPTEAVQAESSTGGALSEGTPQAAEHGSAASTDSEGAEKTSETQGAVAGSSTADPTSTSDSGTKSAVKSSSASQAKEGPGDQAIGASVAPESRNEDQWPDASASQVGTREEETKREGDGSSTGGRPPNEGEDAEVATEVLIRPEPNILSYVADLFAEARVSDFAFLATDEKWTFAEGTWFPDTDIKEALMNFQSMPKLQPLCCFCEVVKNGFYMTEWQACQSLLDMRRNLIEGSLWEAVKGGGTNLPPLSTWGR